MAVERSNLIWIDLEMTGLDPDRDRIIEIATIVTDSGLNVLEEDRCWWCTSPRRCSRAWTSGTRASTGTPASPIGSAAALMGSPMPPGRRSNSSPDSFPPVARRCAATGICQDRRFLARWMPQLERFFHYRNLDVSTVKELCRRWRPDIFDGLSKESRHRALDDVRDSIAELVFYREHFLQLY